jgi:hypothetical protein
MKADFSRDSFNPHRPNTRVLRLQGTPDLESDWNEQVASLVFHDRELACALIGWHGSFDNGFRVTPLTGQHAVRVSPGSYYIDGVRGYMDSEVSLNLADVFSVPSPPPTCLVYLEMWERVFTALEDDEIREVALGGVDTSVRARIVTAVRTLALEGGKMPATRDEFQKRLESDVGQPQYWRRPLPKLRAWVPDKPTDSSAPEARCAPIPSGGYGGPENQLYRVEIHDVDPKRKKTFFKWSRDNGSALYPVRSVDVTPVPAGDGNSGFVISATLTDPRDSSGAALVKDDWVELQCDEVGAAELIPLLLSVATINVGLSGETIVTFNTIARVPADKLPGYLSAGTRSLNHGFLRRWDFRTPTPDAAPEPRPELWDGVPVVVWKGDNEAGTGAIQLEDGVFVRFDTPERCVRGDYWLIPARTKTRDVVWPRSPRIDPEHPEARSKTPEERAKPVEAHRPFHAFAPLAQVTPGTNASTPPTVDLLLGRRELPSLSPSSLSVNQQQGLIVAVRDLVKPEEFTSLTNKQSVAAINVPASLQPEGLKSVQDPELVKDLKNSPLSVLEVASLSEDDEQAEQEWHKFLLLARPKTPLPAEGSAYMKQATQARKDAIKVTQLFATWPSTILTADDIALLAKP